MTGFIVSLLVLTISILKIVLVGAIIAGTMVAANKYIFGQEKFDFKVFTNKDKVEITCTSCKAAIDPAHKFCPYCGTSTVVPGQQAPETKQTA